MSSDRNQPERDVRSHRGFWDVVFVLWLILVNCLYYLQFKALIMSRLTALTHR
jgi:hypothetical protein